MTYTEANEDLIVDILVGEPTCHVSITYKDRHSAKMPTARRKFMRFMGQPSELLSRIYAGLDKAGEPVDIQTQFQVTSRANTMYKNIISRVRKGNEDE